MSQKNSLIYLIPQNIGELYRRLKKRYGTSKEFQERFIKSTGEITHRKRHHNWGKISLEIVAENEEKIVKLLEKFLFRK
jgi:guanylate kinase